MLLYYLDITSLDITCGDITCGDITCGDITSSLDWYWERKSIVQHRKAVCLKLSLKPRSRT